MDRFRAPLAALVIAITMLASARPAAAGVQWCAEDPEFFVNGNIIDVTMLFDGAYAGSIDGSVHFDMRVPWNVLAFPLSLPGAVPVTASISRTLPAWTGGPIPVVVTVSMDASSKFATTTLVSGTYGALTSQITGWSTSPTKASFKLLLP